MSDSVFSIHVHKDLELLFPPYEQMPICLPGIQLVYSVAVEHLGLEASFQDFDFCDRKYVSVAH